VISARYKSTMAMKAMFSVRRRDFKVPTAVRAQTNAPTPLHQGEYGVNAIVARSDEKVVRMTTVVVVTPAHGVSE
jgi:hypothetical protein